MQSKTSYFNKTIFIKNITRFWPIWGAYFLLCLVQLPLTLYTNLTVRATDITDWDVFRLTQLTSTIENALHPFSFFLFAFIIALAVFSYLYQARSANMIHALPVCRESLFITNTTSGICFIVIPHMVAFLVSIFVCFSLEMTQLEYLMHWLLLSTGMSLFAYALAIFTIMITGNMIAAPIFYLFINFGYIVCRTMLCWFVQLLSFGINNTNITTGNFLSPYYFLSGYFGGLFSILFTSPSEVFSISTAYAYIGSYFAVGLILLPLAFFIYKKKHLETTGDIITLPFLKPLSRWLATFCISSGVTFFGLNILMHGKSFRHILPILLILITITSIIIFFLVDMFLTKGFAVFHKKRILECGTYVVIVILCIIGIDLNVFGLESRIPKKDNIASIYVYSSYPFMADDSDFEQILILHQKLIDSKDELKDYIPKYSDSSDATTIDITYTLKNGTMFSRSYTIPLDDYYLSQEDYVYHLATDVRHKPEYYLQYHFTNSYESCTFMDGSFELYNGDNYFDSISLNQAQCTEIFEAFKQDIWEGNYRIYDYTSDTDMSDNVYYNSLYLTYSVPQGSIYASYDGKSTVIGNKDLQYTHISLTPECVHTLQALRDIQVLKNDTQLITQEEATKLFEDDYYGGIEYY